MKKKKEHISTEELLDVKKTLQQINEKNSSDINLTEEHLKILEELYEETKYNKINMKFNAGDIPIEGDIEEYKRSK